MIMFLMTEVKSAKTNSRRYLLQDYPAYWYWRIKHSILILATVLMLSAMVMLTFVALSPSVLPSESRRCDLFIKIRRRIQSRPLVLDLLLHPAVFSHIPWPGDSFRKYV